MRSDTPARRAWMLEHQRTATIREAERKWGVSRSTLYNDEKTLGIRLTRDEPQKKPKGLWKRWADMNTLANAFIRGELR